MMLMLSNICSTCFMIQFHLRAYCVASGDLSVYLYMRLLALFASKPYTPPAPGGAIDLAPHLTNSSLQTHRGEEGVRLLDELVGCHILSRGADAPGSDPTLTLDHLANIQDQVADALAETFTAALQSPIHFQVRSLFLLKRSYEYLGLRCHTAAG
jgi:tubulin--tyrosine ligase